MGLAVIWDIDPVLIEFEWLSSPITNGPLQIRFYGVFFAIGLLGAAWAFPAYFEKLGLPAQARRAPDPVDAARDDRRAPTSST